MGSEKNVSLFGKLRRAVKKINVLLSFSLCRWKLAASIIGFSTSRRLSFNDRPGLRAIIADHDSTETASTDSPYSSSHGGYRRCMSGPSSYSSEDDVDKRSESFIATFRRHLLLERQISLELRYTRGFSFTSSSPSPDYQVFFSVLAI